MLASPRFDPALWFLAWSGGEVAGYAGASLEADEDPARGYVSLLGVRPAFRGRGLGEALLRQAFRELAVRGKLGCDLHVDADSPTGATRLYERSACAPTPASRPGRRSCGPGAERAPPPGRSASYRV